MVFPRRRAAAPRPELLTRSLRSVVFLLALPVLVEQFLSFCVGFYDTWLSGRISEEATSAIGLAAYVSWLASMIYGLVGIGTTALVARFWGAGQFEDAVRVTNRSMSLAALLGLFVYGLVFTSAPVLAGLLNMDAGTAAVAVRYLRLDGLGHVFASMTLIGAAALRGAGDMRSPMWILGLVSIINVIVSTLFVYGPGPFPALGVDGIVTGTIVARVCGGLMMVGWLAVGVSGLQLRLREVLAPDRTIWRILRIGGPAALDGGVMWFGQFLFLMIISRLAEGDLGRAIFAAHVVGIEVEAITYLPAVAWGYATATLVGQSLGAGDHQRARRVGHEAVRQCSILAAVLTVVFFALAPQIYALMHDSEAVQSVGVPAFRLIAFVQVPLVIVIIYTSALRGAGDTRFPMVFTICGVLFVRLPVGYVCGIVLEGGLLGAWIGMAADVTFRAVLVTIRYARGEWVHTQV